MVHLWSKERPIKAEITWKVTKNIVAQLITSNSPFVLLDYQQKNSWKVFVIFFLIPFFPLFLDPE